ncbi:hypothetical protein BDBG_17281 [Blastomyces gilchristii SLH14081]|uniref:Uncharacterized protein n=1 Tax=Blastomyces gilchristii (strain SLH14081) TaxID=559298 RepID=A0A179US71_BLAGS|nr:uncharacterized protein BDBG_17281 [Blastomyces gilchristii SLH14081]OAT09881.1 hypothetical protein BDBG_17281 [Blastomyces gilchristii SLH14081]
MTGLEQQPEAGSGKNKQTLVTYAGTFTEQTPLLGLFGPPALQLSSGRLTRQDHLPLVNTGEWVGGDQNGQKGQ